VTAYRIIAAEEARTPISMACRLLGVSRSGYYAWAAGAPSDREGLSDEVCVVVVMRSRCCAAVAA